MSDVEGKKQRKAYESQVLKVTPTRLRNSICEISYKPHRSSVCKLCPRPTETIKKIACDCMYNRSLLIKYNSNDTRFLKSSHKLCMQHIINDCAPCCPVCVEQVEARLVVSLFVGFRVLSSTK